MKKIFTALLALGLIFLLGSCKDDTICKGSMSECYILSYESDYPLYEDNVYEQIDLATFYDKIDNKERILVYYGQPECSACVHNVGLFDYNAKELGISKIYYLPARVLNGNSEDKKVVDAMQAKYGFDGDSTPDSLPQLWLFDDGEYKDSMRNYIVNNSLNEASKSIMQIYLNNGEE